MKIGQIVSTPSASAWAQVFRGELRLAKEPDRPAQLIVVTELTAPEGFDLPSLGKAVFEKIEQVLINSEEGFSQGLRAALNQGKEVLRQRVVLLAQEPEQVTFSTVAVVVVNQQAYIGQFGGASAGLWRQGQLYVFLTNRITDVVFGRVIANDILILATPAFVSVASREEITAALAGEDLLEAVDSLAPKIHAREMDGRAAAVLIKIEPEDLFQPAGPRETPAPGQETQTPSRESQPRLLVFKQRVLRLVTKFQKGVQVGKSLLERRPRLPNLGFLPFFKGFAPIYVHDGERETKKAKLRLIILVLVSLLVLSVWQGVVGRRLQEQGSDLKQLIVQAGQLHREATSLAELNPIRSRSLLLEAQDLLSQVGARRGDWRSRLPWVSQPAEVSELEELKAQVASLLAEVSRRFEVSTELVLDMDRQAPGASAKTISFFQGQLLVSEAEEGVVWRVDPQKNQGKKLVSDRRIKKARAASEGYILTQDEVLKIGDGKVSLVLENNGQWSQPAAIDRFGANLYVLDRQASQIYKYVGLESGYSSAQNYLASDETNLGQALDMAIDNRVWLITANGEILSFLGGEPEVFVITGLDLVFSPKAKIFTSLEVANLYVLDSGNARVVVLNKSGDYQGQYLNERLTKAIDLVVDEEEGRIYVLSESRVETIQLSD